MAFQFLVIDKVDGHGPSAKIHVWAGISSKGATRIVMFGGGILIADRLGIIFENIIAPFI